MVSVASTPSIEEKTGGDEDNILGMEEQAAAAAATTGKISSSEEGSDAAVEKNKRNIFVGGGGREEGEEQREKRATTTSIASVAAVENGVDASKDEEMAVEENDPCVLELLEVAVAATVLSTKEKEEGQNKNSKNNNTLPSSSTNSAAKNNEKECHKILPAAAKIVPSGDAAFSGTISKSRKSSDDCIEILDDDDDDDHERDEDVQQLDDDDDEEDDDDDDVRVIEEPPASKRPRTSKIIPLGIGAQSRRDASVSPVPEDPTAAKESSLSRSLEGGGDDVSKKRGTTAGGGESSSGAAAVDGTSPLLTSYSVLLDRLELYVKKSQEKGENLERKVLDTLLAAINIQVQKEPYAVRKLILDKQLVLPNTISFPPSQVVDMVIEHDPDHQLSRVINRLFGEERPKLTEVERRERQFLRAMNPAPNMTKLLMDLGQDLVQESTYFDIVHAKNLPEMPKSMDTYKQVAAQLRPVWLALKEKNSPFTLKLHKCHVCGYKTESKTALIVHKQTLHYVGRRYQCTYCREFDTNEHRITKHIFEEHGIKPINTELSPNIMQCPICEAEFHYKVQRDQHIKLCRRDLHKLRSIQVGRAPEDVNAINRWLWDKPPIEPSILSQQQEAAAQQRQQQLRQQQLLLQQQKIQQQQAAAAAAFRAAAVAQQQQQQRLLGSQQQQYQRGPLIGQNATSAGAFAAVAKNLLLGGGGAQNTPLGSRIGNKQLQQTTAQQQRNQQQLLASLTPAQQQQLAVLAAASTRASGGTGGGGSKSSSQGQQPSIGDVLRLAQDKGIPVNNTQLANAKITPQILQAAMQAQMLQMQKNQQIQQKSQQILAAATAANRGGGGGVGTTSGSSGSTSQMGGQRGRPPKNRQLNNNIVANLQGAAASNMQQLNVVGQQIGGLPQICEICDSQHRDRDHYRQHLQTVHKQLRGKTAADMLQGAPLACSRCRERFWTYEGLERHLLMSHGLVTSDLLTKAQTKSDAGRCKLCGKQYAFNILQHLVGDHSVKLCSAEIMYSCDVCSFKCSSYQKLEKHLTEQHPKKAQV